MYDVKIGDISIFCDSMNAVMITLDELFDIDATDQVNQTIVRQLKMDNNEAVFMVGDNHCTVRKH